VLFYHIIIIVIVVLTVVTGWIQWSRDVISSVTSQTTVVWLTLKLKVTE